MFELSRFNKLRKTHVNHEIDLLNLGTWHRKEVALLTRKEVINSIDLSQMEEMLFPVIQSQLK